MKGFKLEQLRGMHMMMTECQKEIEHAFGILSERYDLVHPLLFSHNWILQCLYYADEPMSLTRISQESDIALPNVSVGVQALIENGMIKQSDQVKNRRVRAVQMTPFGRKVCGDYITNFVDDITQRLYAGVSDEMLEQTNAFFEQVAHNVENARRERKGHAH